MRIGQVTDFMGLAVPGLFGQVLPFGSLPYSAGNPVVDGEESERVVQLPGLAQVIDDLSDDPS